MIALLLIPRPPGCHACEGEDPPPPDARPRTDLPPYTEHCAQTCGNGKIDRCWRAYNSAATVYWFTESCDGTINLPTCSQADSRFCGGTTSCGTWCLGIDTSKCTPCN